MGQRPALEIAYIDLIDACHLKCPTCVRGTRTIENSSRKMGLDQFRLILSKLKDEGYPAIGLYSWTEPFLNRTLQDYVSEINNYGLRCLLSSTLSLRHIDNLEETLMAGVDHMIVSMSGMDQETYQINHTSGHLEYVLSNLRRAAGIIHSRGLRTHLVMRFISFPHNVHHMVLAEAFARDLGIHFEVIRGHSDPLTQTYTDQFCEDKIANPPADWPELHGKTCNLMFDQIALDCDGNVYTCCGVPTHPSLQLGKYLDLGEHEILLRRYTHRFCRSCPNPRREATQLDKSRLAIALCLPGGFAAPTEC